MPAAHRALLPSLVLAIVLSVVLVGLLAVLVAHRFARADDDAPAACGGVRAPCPVHHVLD